MSVWQELEQQQERHRWRTAVHESGHVLASWLVDKSPCDRVMCLPGAGSAFVAGSAAAAVAGVVAMEVIGDAEPREGASRDLAYVATMPAWEQRMGWHEARTALGQHRAALEHFARALLANTGRLAGPEVTKALRDALEHQRRKTMVDRTAGPAGDELVEDASFAHMVAQRNIAEALYKAHPKRDFAELMAKADELAVRGVQPEHAAPALEVLEAERSTHGIVREAASMRVTRMPRRR